MPTISTFYGIRILMYYDDHAPPHFHAEYAGERAVVTIQDPHVIAGAIRARALALVREWAVLRSAELQRNWRLAASRQPLDKVEPLP